MEMEIKADPRIYINEGDLRTLIVDNIRREYGTDIPTNRITFLTDEAKFNGCTIQLTVDEMIAIRTEQKAIDESVRPDDPSEAQPARRKART
jgi:hypothetical protein